MKWKKKSQWVTAQRPKISTSAGARIGTGRFSPTSPKGGFAGSAYSGMRELGRYYNYDPETYYGQRLTGSSPDDVRWRYDLNKRLIGRPDYKSRASFPWLPRFPKQKWTKTSRKDVQKNPQFPGSKPGKWIHKFRSSKRHRRYKSWPKFQYRRRRTNGVQGTLSRDTIRYIKSSKYPLLHKLQYTVYP